MPNRSLSNTEKKGVPKIKKPSHRSHPQPYEDDNLVEVAFTRIKEIYFSHAQQAYQEVASYLVETFFNNDIELIKKKLPAEDKAKSFNLLIKRLKDEDARLPKRSWLYNAIGLYLDQHELQEPEIVHAYGQLSVSHKVQLLTIRDLDQKKELIGEINEKGYSVRGLQKRIAEVKLKRKTNESDVFLKQLEKIIGDLSKAKLRMLDIFAPLSDREDYMEIQKKLDELIKEISSLLAQGKAGFDR